MERPAPSVGECWSCHANAVRAAREAHVAHIGYTSVVRPEEMNPAFVAVDHRRPNG